MLLDPRQFRADDLLRRPYVPGETPFGASGACVWATSPAGWGFGGGVCWIHPQHEAGLAPFALRLFVENDEVTPADALHRPSHVTLHGLHANSGLQITEDKFITGDDVVVSVLRLRNPADGGVPLEIELAWGVPAGENRFRPDVPIFVHREGPPGDNLRQMVPAGSRQTLVFAVAFAPSADEAKRRTARWARASDPVGVQVGEYQAWFDEHVPRFDCDDPWLARLWYHRWHLVRKNYLRPEAGCIPAGAFAEGRWESAWRSTVMTRSAGHVLRETRWLRNAQFARDHLRALVQNQRADGLFRSFYVDEIVRSEQDEGKYAEQITAATLDVHHVHPDYAFLAEVLPALEQNIAYWQSQAAPNDVLPVLSDHWQTGMEWQPGFFARSGFDPGPPGSGGREAQNAVTRLDLAAFQYAGVRALAQVENALGHEGVADALNALAERIKAAVLAQTWDPASGFFYDLLPDTDEQITAAKTVAAFFLFDAGLPDAEHARAAWRHLCDPGGAFRTPFPPASTGQDSPAYSQERTMMGRPLSACCGNGPTWPHAASLVISGLARSLRAHGEAVHPPNARQTLWALFQSLGRAQFENNDFSRPYTGPCYRSDTGAWLSGERDVFSSTWADLVITVVAGLVPRNDDVLEIHPLLPALSDGGWTHFCLDDVPYRGRLLSLVWDDPQNQEDAYNDGDKGFTIYVDGRRFHHQNDLSPFSAPLPPSLSASH